MESQVRYLGETQLLKGILEGCILAIIGRGETYGYGILIKLQEYSFTDIQDGTLYPILTRLERKEYISCRIGDSPMGPKRKYYSITMAGRDYLSNFKERYQLITEQANRILFEGRGDVEDENNK